LYSQKEETIQPKKLLHFADSDPDHWNEYKPTTNQSINQQLSQQTNRSINQSISKSANKPTDQSINQSINRLPNQPFMVTITDT
jgi:hypothetical protein